MITTVGTSVIEQSMTRSSEQSQLTRTMLRAPGAFATYALITFSVALHGRHQLDQDKFTQYKTQVATAYHFCIFPSIHQASEYSFFYEYKLQNNKLICIQQIYLQIQILSTTLMYQKYPSVPSQRSRPQPTSKRERLFTDYYKNIYNSNRTKITNNNQYEQKFGGKEYDTFRKKKVSTCNDLNYSSSLNPFAKSKQQKVRFDQPYKETYERKKKVPIHSDHQTDPLRLSYEPPHFQPRTRQEFNNSSILQMEQQKKYYLPAQRQLSGSHRNYRYQLGLSYSLQKLPQHRQTINNSSSITPVLQYRNINHSMQSLTQKVGTRYP